MKFTNKDGELRLCDAAVATNYVTVLFTQADFTFPLQREKVEEMLTNDRGNYDSNSNYHEGVDDPILEPLPISFSCLLDDQAYTNKLVALFSGVTTIAGQACTSTKGTSTLNIQNSAESTITFADPSKFTWDIEVLWDTAGTDYGFRLTEIYFPPGQQTISEGADGVTLNVNGMWYGSATTLSAFTGGSAI